MTVAVWPDDPTEVIPVYAREPSTPFRVIWRRITGAVSIPDSRGGRHHLAADHPTVVEMYRDEGAWIPRPPRAEMSSPVAPGGGGIGCVLMGLLVVAIAVGMVMVAGVGGPAWP
jgi:hypothetical protein